MKQAVQQHRTMSGRQDEAIAIEPRRIGGVMLEMAHP